MVRGYNGSKCNFSASNCEIFVYPWTLVLCWIVRGVFQFCAVAASGMLVICPSYYFENNHKPTSSTIAAGHFLPNYKFQLQPASGNPPNKERKATVLHAPRAVSFPISRFFIAQVSGSTTAALFRDALALNACETAELPPHNPQEKKQSSPQLFVFLFSRRIDEQKTR